MQTAPERDDLSDFQIELFEGAFHLRPGPRLPQPARDYLLHYLRGRSQAGTFGEPNGPAYFSLYQPALNSPAGERALHHRLRRRFEGVRLPAAATIGITRHCQCECEHCSADYHMRTSAADLALPTLAAALQESVALGVTTLILLGGEPLIRRDLPRLIATVDPARVMVVLFTNGELLSARLCRALRNAGLVGAFVSIDSAVPEEHDRARGRPGLFARAREGVRQARAAGLRVALSSYLTTDRLRAGIFHDMLRLAREWEADELTFFDAIPVGRLHGEAVTLLNPKDREFLRDEVRALRRAGARPALSVQSNLTSDCGAAFCFAANTQFYLSSSGWMCPCDFTPLTIGRYPDRSIADLWRDMTGCWPYSERSRSCRMQDARFHETVLAQIPPRAALPYPLARLRAPEGMAQRPLVAPASDTELPTQHAGNVQGTA